MEGLDFSKSFLDIDFDKTLSRVNSAYLNSETHYLKYKKVYLQETKAALAKYNDLIEQIKALDAQNVTVLSGTNGTTTQYTFIDNTTKMKLTSELKMLVLRQRTRKENFLHYISTLKTHDTPIKPKKRSLFNKLKVSV
ncbi:hypothetical protein EB118_12590 [bacterium]|nr:hypothetical protein [bacterium]NDD83064.1 hypothetical protein [bacterium]NDG30897.1 hypothetical protein [bacterium]